MRCGERGGVRPALRLQARLKLAFPRHSVRAKLLRAPMRGGEGGGMPAPLSIPAHLASQAIFAQLLQAPLLAGRVLRNPRTD